MLTTEQYTILRKACDDEREFIRASSKNCFAQGEIPNAVSNDDKAQVELYEWMNDKPTEYFLYIDIKNNTATNWTGIVLGTVRGNLNAKKDRIGIDVIGNNGVKYHGMFYKSSGDYARIKAYKKQ